MAVSSVCACAALPAGAPTATNEASPRKATAADVANAGESLRGGTRGDVIAALGQPTVVRFDSGYEVWVYRFLEPAPRKQASGGAAPAAQRDDSLSELVMLLTPSGTVARVRVRSAGT
jgi:hypothetical protein